MTVKDIIAPTDVLAVQCPSVALHQEIRDRAASRLMAMTKPDRERMGDAMVGYWLAFAEARQNDQDMNDLAREISGIMGPGPGLTTMHAIEKFCGSRGH